MAAVGGVNDLSFIAEGNKMVKDWGTGWWLESRMILLGTVVTAGFAEFLYFL